ncbi:MAG TPA: hypothetical protein VF624_10310 [Tepidisphaeraceae bacterium]|jgi:uncharacterized membrane protein YkgB
MFRAVTWFCYMIALLSVVVSVVLAMFLIWRPDLSSEPFYRGLATTGTLIAASLLMLSVNVTFRRSLSK